MAEQDGTPKLPEQQEDFLQGGAPGGLTFSESELPVVAVLGGPPMQLGGYTPDPSRTPQISNEDDPRGITYLVPPSGLRR